MNGNKVLKMAIHSKRKGGRRYSTPSRKAIELRRNLLLEMIMSDPNTEWTYQAMADRARELPWFAEHMPKYSYLTARRDYLAVQEETKENREVLAEGILVRQLDDTEELIDGLMADLDALGSLSEYLEKNEEMGVSIDQISQYTKAKNTLLNALDRLMNKQADLVPISVPKKMEIDQKTFNFDYYLQVRKDYQHELSAGKKQLHDGIIEGEYQEE